VAAAPPRFQLHLTPTYSSWLNLVERWFAELTTRKLRRSAHRSVAELEADITAWIQAWNDDPSHLCGPRPPTRSWRTSPAIFNESTTQDTR
jgi:transposase